MKPITVELSTPRGVVFAGVSVAIEMRANVALELRPPRENCLSALGSAEITLRQGAQLLSFALENVWASFDEHCLTVLAEVIRPLPERRTP